MKKYSLILFFLAILSCSRYPGSRPWVIPLRTDPSDLEYTPERMESYRHRRDKLTDSLGKGIAVLSSGTREDRNRHGFRPNNYFHYFTGLERPGTYALLKGGEGWNYMLVVPEQDMRSKIYHGEQASRAEILQTHRPDDLVDYSGFRKILDTLLQEDIPVYADLTQDEVTGLLEGSAADGSLTDIRDIGRLADGLRVIKDPVEVERIQKACLITARALVDAMKSCEPGMYEFEIEAVVEGTFLQYGARMPGFPSIIASGPQSTVLHAGENRRKMEKSDLLLMDVGAEYGCYTADITRTIPVDGGFSKEQRDIYRLVLEAQKAAIAKIQPGNGLMDGHQAAVDLLVAGLDSLGLITDPSSSWQTRFYILHTFSHYLGMDVHDVGPMGGTFNGFLRQTLPGGQLRSHPLETGMVLTIEPGLYFRESGLNQIYGMFGEEVDSTELSAFVEEVSPVYAKYARIGVRIEDDILVTEKGHLILSRYAPKEIADIEALMR